MTNPIGRTAYHYFIIAGTRSGVAVTRLVMQEIAMRLLTWTSLFVLTFGVSAAVAQDAKGDTGSAKSMLPHCIAALEPNRQDSIGGHCTGVIATLAFVSRVLPDNLKFCHPNTAAPEQMLQAVIGFVESNPESGGQDFRLVALAAMRDKWPCQE